MSLYRVLCKQVYPYTKTYQKLINFRSLMELTVCGTRNEYHILAKFLNPGKYEKLLIYPEGKCSYLQSSDDPAKTAHAFLDVRSDISGSSNSCDMLIPNCVSGVSSLDCQDGISVSLHEVSSGPLQTSENPGRLMMVSSSIDAVMRHSLGILKINPASVDNLSSLLSLVDYHRPSFLIHAANSDFDFGSSSTYRDWFKSTSVNQHAFLQQKFLLDKDATIEDEMTMIKSVPFKCNILPLKIGRPVVISGNEITSMTFPTPPLLLNPIGKMVDHKRSFTTSNGSDVFRNDMNYDKMKKEYEKKRKDYSSEKKKDVQAKRDKVSKVNQNSGVNSIGEIKLHILNNGCPGTVPSVALTCASKLFLFNSGEGTQLSILEGSKMLKNIDYVFVGSNNYEAFAGLAPLMLTSEAWGSAKVTAYGSPQFRNHLESNYNMLRFLENCDMSNLQFKDIFEEPLKDNIEIQGVQIKSTALDRPHSVCFICYLPDRPGAFSVDKAKNFGIKPGPVVGRLKRGETITLDNGKVVKPEDVVEASKKYGPVIVVDVEDETYLDSLVENDIWSTLEPPRLVVHFTSQEVLDHPQYQKFLKMFPESSENCRHLFLNSQQSTVSSNEGFYHVNFLLNKCCPELFPLIHGSRLKPWSATQEKLSNGIAVGSSYDLWQSNGKLSGQPGLDLTEDALLRKDKKFFEIFGSSTRVLMYDRLFQSNEFKDFRTKFNDLNAESCRGTELTLFPRLVCLGTSSAGPSKYRNVSGYFFQLSDDKCMMLDCGENSYAQMVRHFGLDEALKKVSQTGLIFISHTHADHIGGLPLFLIKRQEAFRSLQLPYRPLLLLCPTYRHLQHLFAFEKEVGKRFFNDDDLTLLCEENFKGFRKPETEKKFISMLEDLKLKSFDCVPVDHRTFKSFGCSFVTSDGFKAAYSGDTLPCLNMVNAASGADLMLHEATHTDDKKYEALCAKHTTISEAVSIHDMARVKFTLLTHFTHRYSKCIPLDLKVLQGRDDIGVAFDHLDVAPHDYKLLPKLVEGYRMIFQDHLEKFAEADVYASEVLPHSEVASNCSEEQTLKKLKLQTE
ncbi:ribonuclease Z, mitochondrial-like [Convolutriloba macropyga]|uniref:ribonuclease Z, mitochondrial-like n=1 Tax=Convolutriloba macropyga TaxID=536237 RepID=UPI003F51B380